MSFSNQNDIEKLFINKTLESIEFYNVNDNYFEFEEDRILTIDGCVELTLDETEVSIGWSKEKEFVDTIEGDVKTLLKGINYYKINDTTVYKEPIGKKVVGVELQFETVDLLDDEFEPTGDTEYFIKELILELEDNSKLQIALISFGVDVANKKMVRPVFDNYSNIMISLNNIVKIRSEV